jgi:class 3 adenylate cyclase
MDYTILGHAVNIASRISQSAEPDQILIGQETYDQIVMSDLFKLQRAGSRLLKGVKGKFRVYEVESFTV